MSEATTTEPWVMKLPPNYLYGSYPARIFTYEGYLLCRKTRLNILKERREKERQK